MDVGSGVSSVDNFPYCARAFGDVLDEISCIAEGFFSFSGSFSLTTASYFLLIPTCLVMWALRLLKCKGIILTPVRVSICSGFLNDRFWQKSF